MESAINKIAKSGTEIKEEDESRLSPLLSNHLNVLGDYSFHLSKNIINGKLRPLSNLIP